MATKLDKAERELLDTLTLDEVNDYWRRIGTKPTDLTKAGIVKVKVAEHADAIYRYYRERRDGVGY